MRRTLWVLAVAAAAVVAASFAASALGTGDPQRAARIGAAAAATAVGTYLVRRIPGAGPGIAGQPEPPDALETLWWRGAAGDRAPDPPERERLRRLVRLSVTNADHAHRRLRPVLRDVADARFADAYGTHPDRDPRAAERLGPAAWEWVRPDRPQPPDRHGRGPSLAEIEAAVTGVERIPTSEQEAP